MKKIIMVVLIMISALGLFAYAKAITYTQDIAYIIYDEEENEIDRGVIGSNSRASFSAITLKDGQMVKFAPDGSTGFLTLTNRLIKFTYKMNKSGYMTTQLYRYKSVREAKNQSTHKGTTLQFVTTTTGYYYALITNDSGSDKNIYGITFDILYP